jgi:hypothetical protein
MSNELLGAARDEVQRLVDRLGGNGPITYRMLPPEERAWRGRYALMAMVVGASAPYAWANAMASGADGEAARALVGTVDEGQLLDAVRREGVQILELYA